MTVDSRLKNGTLTLKVGAGVPVPFQTQTTNVQLVPSTADAGDPLEVLSGDVLTGDEQTSWVLHVDAVQDFDDEAGFVNFAMTNAGEVVDYSWKPNATGPTYAGTVRVRPVLIGGDVAKRNTTSADWPCQQAPTPTYPA